MNIPQETLDKIVAELPEGGQKQISEHCGYSPEYVEAVLCGRSPVTDKSVKIIYKAQAIIRDARENKLKKQ